MFIFKDTRKRANPFAPYVDGQGTQHSRIPMDLLEEVPDPQAPEGYSEDTHYRVEQDEAPYVVYTPKSEEQIAQVMLAKAKAARAAEVARIVVTTSNGMSFDGHEDAQNRMSRTKGMMTDTDTLPWVLADNTVVTVTKDILEEALRLSGLKMAELWVKPYTN